MNSENEVMTSTVEEMITYTDDGYVSLKDSSHEDLWDAHITIRDGSTWQIISLNKNRTEIKAKHIAGNTFIGELDTEGQRIATILDKDIKRLMK